jgi:hypothetical protein
MLWFVSRKVDQVDGGQFRSGREAEMAEPRNVPNCIDAMELPGDDTPSST